MQDQSAEIDAVSSGAHHLFEVVGGPRQDARRPSGISALNMSDADRKLAPAPATSRARPRVRSSTRPRAPLAH